MLDKKTKKPVVLPHVGKPKKKPAKSSVRDLGRKANKDYKSAAKTVVGNLRKENGWEKDVDNATEREWARQTAKIWERDRQRTSLGLKSASKGRKVATEEERQAMARSTGMSKGGLVAKRGKK